MNTQKKLFAFKLAGKQAVKPVPKVPPVGALVMVGAVGVALLTTAVLSELELLV